MPRAALKEISYIARSNLKCYRSLMHSALRWLWRGISVVAIIATVALVLYVAAVPGFAKSKILAALSDMGIPDASVEVRSITTGHLQITDLNIGDDTGLRVGAIGADYSTSLTGDVRIRTIRVVGAQLRARLEDGKLDLGPLDKLFAKREKTSTERIELPFDRLELVASSLGLQWQGWNLRLPLSGTLIHHGAGKCDIEAELELAGVVVPLRGSIDVNEVSGALVIADGGDGDGFEIRAALSRDEAGASTLNVDLAGKRKSAHIKVVGGEIEATDISVQVRSSFHLSSGELQSRVTLAAENLVAKSAAASATLQRADVKLDISGQRSAKAYKLRLQEGQAVRVASIAVKRGEATVHVDALEWVLKAAEVTLPWRTPEDARIVSRLSASTVKARGPGGNVDVPQVDLDLGWPSSSVPGGTGPAAGVLAIKDMAVDVPAAKLKLAGISLRTPINIVDSPLKDARASLAIDTVVWDGRKYPLLKGTTQVVDGSLGLAITWALFEQAPLQMAGELDLASMTGRITAKVQSLRLTDDKTLPKMLGWKEDDLKLTGIFDLDAAIELADGQVTPRIRLAVREGTFLGTRYDIALTGIQGAIIIDSFAPLSTPPNQRLVITNGHIGSLNLNSANLLFRLEALDSLLIELATWRIGTQGKFWVHACRFDPAKPVLETQVFIEDLTLPQWLSILTSEEVKGEGDLVGRLPIRVDSSRDPLLSFGEGFLYAKPGKGWVSFSQKAESTALIARSLKELVGELQQEVKRRLLEAAADYEYDTLQFDFIREDNKLLCRIKTSGRGRSGTKQEIGGLELNIHDFGALLANQILRGANAPGALDAALKRALGVE